MANEENEKHKDVISEMRIFKCRNLATNKLENCPVIQGYLADRLEAAHKREIDAKDAEESERLSRIYNIVIDSNEENWRDCMSRIEAITREVI